MSSKPQEQQNNKPEAQTAQLSGLEEDDEFEEFAAQGTISAISSCRVAVFLRDKTLATDRESQLLTPRDTGEWELDLLTAIVDGGTAFITSPSTIRTRTLLDRILTVDPIPCWLIRLE
jgi:hypothetical protein